MPYLSGARILGRLQGRVRALEDGLDRQEKQWTGALADLKDEMRGLRNQVWLVILTALVGPVAAILVARVLGG